MLQAKLVSARIPTALQRVIEGMRPPPRPETAAKDPSDPPLKPNSEVDDTPQQQSAELACVAPTHGRLAANDGCLVEEAEVIIADDHFTTDESSVLTP